MGDILAGIEDPWNEILTHIRPYRRVELAGGWWGLVARRRSRQDRGNPEGSGEDDASFIGREVTLSDHCRRVRDVAGGFARAVGLPSGVVADIQLAGWFHDIGKADPRFQRMLVGGSEVRFAMLQEWLAKSAVADRDLRSRRVAWERAGLPPKHRHELVGVSLLQSRGDALIAADDRDLVLYLIGSHHGWGRPFAPAVQDPSPVDVRLRHGDLEFQGTSDHQLARLDSGLADRFWDLVERYGWWGLAWMEAIVQLADHRVSEMEEVDG